MKRVDTGRCPESNRVKLHVPLVGENAGKLGAWRLERLEAIELRIWEPAGGNESKLTAVCADIHDGREVVMKSHRVMLDRRDHPEAEGTSIGSMR